MIDFDNIEGLYITKVNPQYTKHNIHIEYYKDIPFLQDSFGILNDEGTAYLTNIYLHEVYFGKSGYAIGRIGASEFPICRVEVLAAMKLLTLDELIKLRFNNKVVEE